MDDLSEPISDARARGRGFGVESIQARMDIIAMFPIHVNGAYRESGSRSSRTKA